MQGAYGIFYREDPSSQGTASDYGTRWAFVNAPEEDRKLYETERYYAGTLIYAFDIAEDGNYTVILKFSEVYFRDPGQKVFNVFINDILVKRNLDILAETGATGLAYDLRIDISIDRKELTIGEEKCATDGQLFIKFTPIVDNPKINAIAILTGTSDSLPPPPAAYVDEGSASSTPGVGHWSAPVNSTVHPRLAHACSEVSKTSETHIDTLISTTCNQWRS
ncbi:hypothetical protein OESDEN_04891 [Oesophagostomum dentatum]|uniref:Malectin domain-containing protein n=1 Tax=Oesophagostomum dentatum TaxID=61180 RepID=A0A0B1THA2_OESDE|nr:hypothetical protein OESDEN_04891 [Oesophagostomum dentatum]